MNTCGFLKAFITTALAVTSLFICIGCDSKPTPTAPTLESLQQSLRVSLPSDAKLIGGSGGKSGSGMTALWLVHSKDPFPFPSPEESESVEPQKKQKRPKGTEFPVSALSNLIAACDVSEEDAPRFTDQYGTSYIGQIENRQFTYREAQTESGWVTAIELYMNLR